MNLNQTSKTQVSCLSKNIAGKLVNNYAK